MLEILDKKTGNITLLLILFLGIGFEYQISKRFPTHAACSYQIINDFNALHSQLGITVHF